jgi:hypothetical protein
MPHLKQSSVEDEIKNLTDNNWHFGIATP